jgi:prolyl-tRNA synthetase
MRQRTMLMPTWRETPSDAEAASHALLLRAGYIRQLAAGVYTYLPLGLRVLNRIADIVREEMDQTSAQELLLPAMQPAELWRESGRYSQYGPELVRFHDRHNREFALGPTHEEVITALVRDELSSYRQLPAIMFQIQTKFRDERRPRFGLLRGREFLMKDGYSFDVSEEGLDRSYHSMYSAYTRIFERIGLDFRAVEADAGTMGDGGGTHEFMALAEIGEDTVVFCSHCSYAANLEKAEGTGALSESKDTEVLHEDGSVASGIELIHTPGIRTIGELVQFLGTDVRHIIKTLVVLADGAPVAVLLRGDREMNEAKVRSYLGADILELADADAVRSATGAPVGFAGPHGLKIRIIADREVASMGFCFAGANKQDYHYGQIQPGLHFPLDDTGDFRNAEAGEGCPRCTTGRLEFRRGIEVGHVFKLGTRYSAKLGASVKASDGTDIPLVMGCYGIGISRLMAAVAEQHHDHNGLIWPAAIAPFHVHIIPVSIRDKVQVRAAEDLYKELRQAGYEVLLDDRDERPGVKFKDSDLSGIPWRIVVGRMAGEGLVELTARSTGETCTIKVEEAVKVVAGSTGAGKIN